MSFLKPTSVAMSKEKKLKAVALEMATAGMET